MMFLMFINQYSGVPNIQTESILGSMGESVFEDLTKINNRALSSAYYLHFFNKNVQTINDV